jgi:hypothetical protein
MIKISELKRIIETFDEDLEVVLDKDDDGWYEASGSLSLHLIETSEGEKVVLSFDRVY